MVHPHYEGDVPERGYSFLADEVRRPGPFDREEVEEALGYYFELAAHGTATGDWNPWADLFTDDAVYVEHSFGVMRGREAMRDWVTTVTGAKPSPLVVSDGWHMIDNDLVVVYTLNSYPAPDGGAPYQFIGLSPFCYAGEGLWCYEEDVTNTGEIERISTLFFDAVQAKP